MGAVGVYCTQPCICGTRNSGSDTENSVPFVSSTTNLLVQFREIIVVYCERHTKHKDGLWTECTAHNDKPLRSIVNKSKNIHEKSRSGQLTIRHRLESGNNLQTASHKNRGLI